jgi:fructokinase
LSILVIGESLIDSVVADGENTRSSPGGSPMNVAVGLSRLGHDVTFATQIGEDADGEMIVDCLGRETLTVINEPGERTSRAHATVKSDGSADYRFDITWDLRLDRLHSRAALRTAGMVHTGSLGAHFPPGGSQVLREVMARAGRSVISYDPNCRPSILADRAATRYEAEQFASVSDVVKASDEDLRWLYPDSSLGDVLEQWIRAGVGLMVITRGSDNALAGTASGIRLSSASDRVEVLDTIGAGDSYMAALLSELQLLGVRGPTGRSALDALSRDELAAVMTRAAAAAAITCSRAGANPPSRAELDSYIVDSPHP